MLLKCIQFGAITHHHQRYSSRQCRRIQQYIHTFFVNDPTKVEHVIPDFVRCRMFSCFIRVAQHAPPKRLFAPKIFGFVRHEFAGKQKGVHVLAVDVHQFVCISLNRTGDTVGYRIMATAIDYRPVKLSTLALFAKFSMMVKLVIRADVFVIVATHHYGYASFTRSIKDCRCQLYIYRKRMYDIGFEVCNQSCHRPFGITVINHAREIDHLVQHASRIIGSNLRKIITPRRINKIIHCRKEGDLMTLRC